MKRILASLKAHSGVAAITGGREYRDQAPDSAALPYIVLSIAASQPGVNLKGATGIDRHRIQIDAWALSHTDKDALVTAIRSWADNTNTAAQTAMAASTYDAAIHFQLVPKNEQTSFNNLRGASRGMLEYDIWLKH